MLQEVGKNRISSLPAERLQIIFTSAPIAILWPLFYFFCLVKVIYLQVIEAMNSHTNENA